MAHSHPFGNPTDSNRPGAAIVNTIHGLLSDEASYQGSPRHVEFLRKHGFLRVIGKETPNNCRFEYPEVQDYLRARVAVDSICGDAKVLGDDDFSPLRYRAGAPSRFYFSLT